MQPSKTARSECRSISVFHTAKSEEIEHNFKGILEHVHHVHQTLLSISSQVRIARMDKDRFHLLASMFIDERLSHFRLERECPESVVCLSLWLQRGHGREPRVALYVFVST